MIPYPRIHPGPTFACTASGGAGSGGPYLSLRGCFAGIFFHDPSVMTRFLRVETGEPVFDGFPGRVADFLEKDRVDLVVDGQKVHGYRSPDDPGLWIRDHSDILRGARYFDGELKSAVEFFARHRLPTGTVLDFVSPADGRENWDRFVRVPVEADVEFRLVKALFLAWQACGDDDWAGRLLPAAEEALAYTMSHPWRWDPNRRLVKRALTIDTWDFTLPPPGRDWLHFRVDEHTRWGIFHGDNTGLFEACRLLGRMWRALGEVDRAARWEEEAAGLKERTGRVCWNGRFYSHWTPIDGFRPKGVDTEAQLSLSNPMAINRGAAGPAQARAILAEYRGRERRSGAFAGWFSLDPPFPAGFFGEEKLVPGAYVNGGILPLVGGELARAALENGMEEYGVSILKKYSEMIAATGETFLWYFPDGRPGREEDSTSPEATPTDGWGSSAMLWAFVEGLCGVADQNKLFQGLRLSPRWVAAGVEEARVEAGYAASGARVSYTFAWNRRRRRMELEVESPAGGTLRFLLPRGEDPARAFLEEKEVPFTREEAGASTYAALVLPGGGRIRAALEY